MAAVWKKTSQRSHFTAQILRHKPGSTQNICCSVQPKHFLLVRDSLVWIDAGRRASSQVSSCRLFNMTAGTGPVDRRPGSALFVCSCGWRNDGYDAIDAFGWSLFILPETLLQLLTCFLARDLESTVNGLERWYWRTFGLYGRYLPGNSRAT